MSRNLVEKVLWKLSVERSSKSRFKEDPRAFLAQFRMSEEESECVLSFDVGALQRMGVNPMLTMGFWQELAPDRCMRWYKERLGATDQQRAAFSAALKG